MRLRGPKPKIWQGYRNCSKCTRWRPVSDFTVYKTRSGFEQIKSECEVCKRGRETARYDEMSPEQKKAKGKLANINAERRRNKALRQIDRLKIDLDAAERQIEVQKLKLAEARAAVPRGTFSGNGIDIVPFRMWLLEFHRMNDYSVPKVAALIGHSERQVYRWLNGYDRNGARAPVPVRSINVETVRNVGNAIDEPRLLENLYPSQVE